MRAEYRAPLRGLPAGASRSRRYAVSAAFLATSAFLGCGKSETGDDANEAGASGDAGTHASGGTESGGSAGNVSAGVGGTSDGKGGSGDGGTSSGRGGSGVTGGGAGTLQGGSGAATGGSGQAGATGGAAGSAGAAGTGGLMTGDRACSGYQERPGCRTAADCPPSAYRTYCTLDPPGPRCRPPMNTCPVACAEGMVCMPYDACGNSQCVAQCTDETCNGENHCVDNACVPRPCDEDAAPPCPEGFECDAAYTSASNHCRPIACSDGFECPSWTDCGTAAIDHGCGSRACGSDADCGECGYCVEGACAPILGVCYQELPAMPYGCVWPDEELV
ncbi:MAG TPA: hypothetical protein VGK73_02435 [Polyangiaceae bacterium]